MNFPAAIAAMARGIRVVIVAAGTLILAGTDLVPAAEPETAADRPRLALVGTVIGKNKALAMFNDPSTGKIVSLRVGDLYDGWRLGAIETGKAIFEKGGQTANYALREQAPGQMSRPYIAPAPPPRAPAGAPAQADKSQSRPAATPSQGDPAASKGNTDDPVADWFRRQRR